MRDEGLLGEFFMPNGYVPPEGVKEVILMMISCILKRVMITWCCSVFLLSCGYQIRGVPGCSDGMRLCHPDEEADGNGSH